MTDEGRFELYSHIPRKLESGKKSLALRKIVNSCGHGTPTLYEGKCKYANRK